MNKRLKTVIAIIALGFVIYFALPFISKELIFGDSSLTDYQMKVVSIWALLISVVIILFGIGRIIDYAATADSQTNKKVKILMYSGLFLLFLPYFLPLVFLLTDMLFYLYPTYIIEFLHKTMIHVAGFVILTTWGIKTAWDNKEYMDESPVFEAFINRFSNLTGWGWAFYILLALLVVGYVVVLVDGMPREKPKDSVVTIAASGNLYWDTSSSHRKPESVLQNDTIMRIHRIKETRMLITMADGSNGWFEIPFIKPAKGWNGYLFKRINTNDLKVHPVRNSTAILEANKDGFRRSYQKNTDLKILEIQIDQEAFERNKRVSSFAMWAKVSVRDNRAKANVVGWLPYSQIRIHGQMHNNANHWIWTPLKWINFKLGDGFFAGLVNVILTLIFISSTAFVATKFVSTKLRFLPNFVLSIMLIICSIALLYNFYFSFFDASAFNWTNWRNETAHLLYLGILGALVFGALKVLIQSIYEERCPECKYWEGYVYNRKLLFRDKKRYKFWTETRYNDGTTRVSNERVETHIDEKWKDFCECGKCGNRWTLRRQEHEKK